MTPKEKAKELVEKYSDISIIYPVIDENGIHLENKSKECALIAVDEIINSNPTIINGVSDFRINIYYWEAVKKEIEKL